MAQIISFEDNYTIPTNLKATNGDELHLRVQINKMQKSRAECYQAVMYFVNTEGQMLQPRIDIMDNIQLPRNQYLKCEVEEHAEKPTGTIKCMYAYEDHFSEFVEEFVGWLDEQAT